MIIQTHYFINPIDRINSKTKKRALLMKATDKDFEYLCKIGKIGKI